MSPAPSEDLANAEKEPVLPARPRPVFLIMAEASVVSVSSPAAGHLARWQPTAAGMTAFSQSFVVDGSSVTMEVTARPDGTASRVTFKSNGKEAFLDIPPDDQGRVDTWCRIRPEGDFAFREFPDYS